MAVQWKNHTMWNLTVPQDKKFSTVITKLLGPCSSPIPQDKKFSTVIMFHVQANHIESDMSDWFRRS